MKLAERKTPEHFSFLRSLNLKERSIPKLWVFSNLCCNSRDLSNLNDDMVNEFGWDRPVTNSKRLIRKFGVLLSEMKNLFVDWSDALLEKKLCEFHFRQYQYTDYYLFFLKVLYVFLLTPKKVRSISRHLFSSILNALLSLY